MFCLLATTGFAVDVYLGRLSQLTWAGSGNNRTALWGGSVSPYWTDYTYVGRWDFETTNASGNYLDTSTNGLTGTNSSCVTVITGTNSEGRVEHGIRFNGSSQVIVNQGNNGVVTNLTNYTTLFWVYFGDSVGLRMVNKNSASKLQVQSGTVLGTTLYYQMGNLVDGNQVRSAATLITGQWYHFALTRDSTLGTACQIQIYKDGLFGTASTNVLTGNPQDIYDSGPLLFGYDTFDPAYLSANSILDEIRIYDGVMSASQISNVYTYTHPTNNMVLR